MAIMQKLGKLLSGIITIIAAVVILTALLLAVLQIKPAIVMSGSMEPAIHTGSVVLINTKNKEAEEGDIIAFQRGDMFVTHRVTDITASGFLTKGDANDSADPGMVDKSQVIGTTLLSLPRAGYLLHALQTTWGLIGIICILLLTLLCREKGTTT